MGEAFAVGGDIGGFRNDEPCTPSGPLLMIGYQPIGHFPTHGTVVGDHSRKDDTVTQLQPSHTGWKQCDVFHDLSS